METPDASTNPDALEAILHGIADTIGEGQLARGDLVPRLGFVSELLSTLHEPIPIPALIYRGRDQRVCVVPIGERWRFGRNPDCDLSFPGLREISRLHFEITRVEDGYLLSDCGSSNGTCIRGKAGKITSHRLLNGDIIEAGGFSFVFIQE